MAITAKDLRAAATEFSDELSQLFNTTITKGGRFVPKMGLADDGGDHVVMRAEFCSSGGVPLRTKHGPATLSLKQVLRSREAEGKHDLETHSYRYVIKFGDAKHPAIRWEYEKYRAEGKRLWNRNHVQGDQNLALGNEETVKMNDWHIPSGWVCIEDIIRFCIVDLEVKPIKTALAVDPTDKLKIPKWDKILVAGVQKFRTQNTPQGN